MAYRRSPQADPPRPIPTGLVSAIDPSVRRAGRFEVSIDGTSAATLSLAVIERLALRIGCPIDESMAARIEVERANVRVYDRGAAMLAARGRSAADLRRVLMRKGEAADAVDQAVERLRDEGFLNDAEFARNFTRAKAAGAGLPKRRIQQELGRLGVERETANEAVGEVFKEEAIDDAVSIERVAEKKLRTLRRLDAAVQRRRLFGFLARRGYDGSAIQEVVRRLVSEAADGDGGLEE